MADPGWRTLSRSDQDVVLMHHEGNFNGNPTLTALLEMLTDSGVRALVVTARRADLDQTPPVRGVDVVTYAGWRRAVMRRVAELRLPAWTHSVATRLALGRPIRARVLVGVDREGLLMAGAWRHAAGRLALLSFEIMPMSETGAAFKRDERRLAPHVDVVIVQDEVRAGDLVSELGIERDRALLAPVSGRGVWAVDPTMSLRARLGIDPGERLLVAAGSVANWSGAAWLPPVLRSLPDAWRVVVHERQGRVRAMTELRGDRLIVSADPVASVRDVPSLVVGADAGLALYVPQPGNPMIGRNIAHVGLASGKVAAYLAAGVPVITNDRGVLGRTLTDRGAGIVVDEPSDVARALNTISESSGWPERCRGVFDELLDADRTLAPVVRWIVRQARRRTDDAWRERGQALAEDEPHTAD